MALPASWYGTICKNSPWVFGAPLVSEFWSRRITPLSLRCFCCYSLSHCISTKWVSISTGNSATWTDSVGEMVILLQARVLDSSVVQNNPEKWKVISFVVTERMTPVSHKSVREPSIAGSQCVVFCLFYWNSFTFYKMINYPLAGISVPRVYGF